MSLARELITHLLVATMLINILIRTYLGAKNRDRLIRRLTAEPGARIRFYRGFIVRLWIWAALVALAGFVSTDLSLADLGWSWPDGDGFDYALTGWLLVVIFFGGLRARRRMRRGQAIPGRAGTAPLVPQTAPERRWAGGVSFTAGIAEEILYRGFLIAAGTQLYGLPTALAAVAALALFGAAHAYQGRKGMINATAVGVALTLVYLLSGSLLLVMVLHVCQDLVALLLIPAHPSAPQPTNDAVVAPTSEPAAPAPAPADALPRVMPAVIRAPHPDARPRSPIG
jgi:membrane protease YdiL (CAAX protease family)